ncbi:MAG: hypothetical protein U0236_15755 [Nitrospira sp.]
MGPSDYAGKHLTPVQGSIDIEVNEVLNSGRVIAQFTEETDHYRIVFDRFAAKQPFHDGGIATRVYEHGDSNNGDPLYPKPGCIWQAGEPPPSSRTMRCSTRTMTLILW